MVLYDRSYSLPANAGSSSRASNNYLIVHDTGNDANQGANSAKNEAAYMQRNWADAYTHAIAGWDRVYLVGEPGYVAYGAGAVANSRSPFQIELAHYADSKLAILAYRNYIEAIREYAKMYGIPLTLDGSGNGVKSHKWVSDNIWGDHQDPYGYLSRIGISKDRFAADIANGVGSNPVQPSAPAPASAPAPSNNIKKVDIFYGLHVRGGDWLDEVKNFNTVDGNGYAGMPNHAHDLLYIKVSRGSIKYRVHTIERGWLDWVSAGNRNDTVNGCAGIKGFTIDLVQAYFYTPSGEPYQQVYYQSQTTERSYWLNTVCDDNGYAGELNEPMDRLRMAIATSDPFPK